MLREAQRWILVATLALTPTATLAQGPGNGPDHDNRPPFIPDHRTVTVDCGASDSLAAALATRALELTVAFSGTCVEDVEIARDHTQLMSDGSGVIDGSLTVRGATDVTLEDFSVVNGRGVRITGGSSAEVTRVSSTDSSLGLGFRVEQSSNAVLTDVSAINNLFAGIAAINNSHIRLLGSVEARQSTDVGIFAAGSSEIDSRAVSAVVADNAFAGLFVQTGASVLFATLSSSNNGAIGVQLIDGGIAVVNGGSVSANLYGIDLDTGSTAEINGLTVDGGGVAVLGNSSLRASGLSVVGSPHPDVGTGMVVQSSHLLLFGGSIDNSLYLAEGGEANFGFTPVTINGGLVCEPSAIAYGGQSCPP